MAEKVSADNAKHASGNAPSAAVADDHAQTKKGGTKPQHGQRDSRRKDERRWTGFERSSVIIQAFTFVALVIYTFFSWHQWRAMQEANRLTQIGADASKRAVEFSQRARLAAIAMEEFNLTTDADQRIVVSLENSGSLPATDVSGVGSWDIRKDEIPADRGAWLKTVKHQPVRPVMLPGRGPEMIPFPIPQFSAETIQEIKEGRVRFYYSGVFTYNDGFGNIKSLGFCGLHHRGDDSWDICPNNNWAD